MKSLVKKALAKSARNSAVWGMLNATLLRLTRFIERERYRNENAAPPAVLDWGAALRSISPDMTVRHGLFRGMKYPVDKVVGGQLVPKVLGSYERELHPLFERLRGRDYSEIVDIGCAEGYYAVGLARMFPRARIFAYDTNAEGIRLCRLVALENGVDNRIVTGLFCDAVALQALPLTRRALVFSDCEGYEKHLFTPDTVRKLAAHDVLIEVHDMADINISARLREVFKGTHDLEVIQSLDDIKKAQKYDYPELAQFDLAQRKMLLAEIRGCIMEWFYFSPRS
jgi:SAM-dependent methyltransferase